MLKLWNDMKYFWSKKCFACAIPVMMVLSYITLLMNPTIGIDDTSFSLYYVDGVSPAMGRWCLYLIHKILPLDYNPHFVEAVGLGCFCLSITLWCVVFYRMFGEKLSVGAYTIFGMVMLSSPIISEVVIWYLQDGIYLGYGATALAVLFSMELFRYGENAGTPVVGKGAWRAHFDNAFVWKTLRTYLMAILMLAVAIGFYEAFMIVYLMGMVMNFLLIHVLEKQDYVKKVSGWMLRGIVLCVGAMLLRTVFVSGITLIDGLQEEALILESRGLGDIFGLVGGWFDGSKSGAEFVFVLKDFFVKYYLNAICYTPIMILVVAVGILGLWGIVSTVRRKNGLILAAIAGIILLPWIMPVLEGWATYYRASQYVPLLTAFAVLIVAWEIRNIEKIWVKRVALLVAGFVLYWQGYEMNRWLHVDAMKYEYEKNVMTGIAMDILEECDESKPVCVVGSFETPIGLIEDVYVPEWSKKNVIIKALIDVLDEDIYHKYNVPGLGYATAETPQLSTINWGTYAYSTPGRELIKFWKMHGFSFNWDSEISHYAAAEEILQNQPVWPEQGYIVEMENYIIVNLGNDK